jgi:hypothetical protein
MYVGRQPDFSQCMLIDKQGLCKTDCKLIRQGDNKNDKNNREQVNSKNVEKVNSIGKNIATEKQLIRFGVKKGL